LKKRLGYFSFICSLIFLCSCSISTTSPERERQNQELKILDENLDLKEQIAELEKDIERLKHNQEMTELAEEDVYRFLQAMKDRNTDELQQRVAENAQLDASGIIFNNGQSLKFEEQHANKPLLFVRLRKEDGDIEAGKLVYDVLPDTEDRYLQLEVILQNDTWKVTGFSKQHL